MKVKKIGFAAIPVTEMKRARAFYEGELHLKVADEMMGGQWIEYEVGGDTLAIASVGKQWTPSDQGTSAALEVEDFDETVQKLKVAAIRFAADPSRRPAVTWPWCRTRTGTSLSFTN